ncbi:MAG: hypothetical protein AAF394_11805, partial [Planctomycetota bacterium]
MQAALVDLLKANRQLRTFTIGYATISGKTQLVADLPRGLLSPFEQFISAKYPDVRVRRERELNPIQGNVWHQTLWITPDIQPLRLHDAFQDHQIRNFADPVATLLEAVAPKLGIDGRILLHVTPARFLDRWVNRRVLQRLSNPIWETRTILADMYADWANGPWWKRVCVIPVALFVGRRPVAQRLAICEQKLCEPLVRVAISIEARGERATDRELKKRLALLMGALGQFAEPGRVTFGSTSPRRGADQPGRRSLLSVPELASLWHAPTDTVQTPSLARPAYRQLPPPVEL